MRGKRASEATRRHRVYELAVLLILAMRLYAPEGHPNCLRLAWSDDRVQLFIASRVAVGCNGDRRIFIDLNAV